MAANGVGSSCSAWVGDICLRDDIFDHSSVQAKKIMIMADH